VIKTPPAAILILDAAKKQKGSAEPNRTKVGSITWDQVKTIAQTKCQTSTHSKLSRP
jgi:large subunit ribosomal protein L11